MTPLQRSIKGLVFVGLLTPSVNSSAKSSEVQAVQAVQACADDNTCAQFNRAAILLYEQKRYDEALVQFLLAYKTVPSDNLLLNIGRTLHYLKRYKEALEYYRKYQDHVPNMSPDDRDRVERFTSQTNEESANAILINKSINYHKYRKSAEGFIRVESFRDAVEAIQLAYHEVPSVEIAILLGKCLSGLGLYPEAIGLLRTITSRHENLSIENKQDIDAFIRTSQIHLDEDRGSRPDLPTLLDKSMRVSLTDISSGTIDGLKYYSHEDYGKALDAFQDEYIKRPDFSLLLAIARTLHRKGDLRGALNHYFKYGQTSDWDTSARPASTAALRQRIITTCITNAQSEMKRREVLEHQGVLAIAQSLLAQIKIDTLVSPPQPPAPESTPAVRQPGALRPPARLPIQEDDTEFPTADLTFRIEADSPDATLCRAAGSQTVYGVGLYGTVMSTTVRTWEKVCTAPCRTHFDRLGTFKISGPTIVDSSEFSLPVAGSASLKVRSYSRASRNVSIAIAILGGLAIGGGATVIALSSNSDYSAAQRTPYYAGGGVMAGIGLAAFIAGMVGTFKRTQVDGTEPANKQWSPSPSD